VNCGGEFCVAKKKQKTNRIPFRINLIFFIVFILFSVLVIQLGVVQILDGETYQTEIDRTISDISKSPVPRGKIYDRHGKKMVDTEPLYSITYTPPKRVQAKDKLDLAEKLMAFLKPNQKQIDKVTDRNKKEYWYLQNKEEAMNRLSKEEIDSLDDVDQYNLALKRITDEDISDLSDYEMQVIAIKRELDKAYALTPEVIKNEDISIEEYAKVAEHLSLLPGVNASMDWDRKYLYKDTWESIIGSITTQEQGIPQEKEDYYLTRGYSRNDRVGKSGLEEQYEDVLRGRKEQTKYTTNKNGDVIGSEIITPGERGKDLILTIDIDFQEKVDDIVLKELKAAKGYGNPFLEDALAVAMNPQTGEILALSAFHYNSDKGEYENAPHKTLYDSHRPGSTVKGATILAGFGTGAISPGDTFVDRPLKFRDTPTKGSYARLGPVNDIAALKRSSNVYMFYTGLRIGGDYRHPIPDNANAIANPREGMQKMRNYFNQLGLGVKTGIDFPFESTGYEGDPSMTGLLDIGIGQFDTYTAVQIAQYVATIANDGYRVQPHLVKEIRNASTEDELGSIFKVNQTKVLNKLNVDDQQLKRVQEGFRKAFNEAGGTGHAYWADAKYKPAGKTGTAENAVYGTRDDGTSYIKGETENLALIGYAPYDDPEIAFAVIVPNLSKSGGNAINHKIGRGLMDAYFEND